MILNIWQHLQCTHQLSTDNKTCVYKRVKRITIKNRSDSDPILPISPPVTLRRIRECAIEIHIQSSSQETISRISTTAWLILIKVTIRPLWECPWHEELLGLDEMRILCRACPVWTMLSSVSLETCSRYQRKEILTVIWLLSSSLIFPWSAGAIAWSLSWGVWGWKEGSRKGND